MRYRKPFSCRIFVPFRASARTLIVCNPYIDLVTKHKDGLKFGRKFIFYTNPFIHNITSYHRKRHPMRHRHIFRQSLAYLVPELTVCITAKKVRCRRDSLQHFSIFIIPRCLSRKQQRLRPLSWLLACRMPKCVSHCCTSQQKERLRIRLRK